MAAVGVAGRIGVVLEQIDVAADAFVGQPLLGVDQQILEHPLPGAVMRDELEQVVTLGRRVLGMTAHVEVQPGTVTQEHVRTAAPRDHPAKEVPGNLVRGQPPVTVKGAGHTEFRLDAHDSSLHISETTCWGMVTVCKRAAGVYNPPST